MGSLLGLGTHKIIEWMQNIVSELREDRKLNEQKEYHLKQLVDCWMWNRQQELAHRAYSILSVQFIWKKKGYSNVWNVYTWRTCSVHRTGKIRFDWLSANAEIGENVQQQTAKNIANARQE